MTGPAITLTPQTALIGQGSLLVGPNAGTQFTNLSSEWGFKGDLMAGASESGPIGSFGISAVGDVNFGADAYGPGDRFDTSMNLFPPPSGSLNGAEGSLVGLSLSPNVGFKGPVVQDQMVFTFEIWNGSLEPYGITNVQPMFGTDGAFLVPEPASVLLLGCGLIGLVLWGRKLGKRIPV